MVMEGSLVPRPYFQFVGPGAQICDSMGVVMEITFLLVRVCASA
jgi:hypothetical protein